jgi:hypothetical protein
VPLAKERDGRTGGPAIQKLKNAAPPLARVQREGTFHPPPVKRGSSFQRKGKRRSVRRGVGARNAKVSEAPGYVGEGLILKTTESHKPSRSTRSSTEISFTLEGCSSQSSPARNRRGPRGIGPIVGLARGAPELYRQ